MRLTLSVTRTLDLEAPRSTRLYHARLWARVRFRTTTGWSELHSALVDTGAPYSLIPLPLWPALCVQHLQERPIGGVVPGETAQLRGTLAKISAQVLDERTYSPRLSLWAMLADSYHAPLILGWAGCLDRTRLVLDGPHRVAWLEF